MKTLRVVIVLVSFCMVTLQSINAQTSDSVRAELLRMRNDDQEIRNKMVEEGMDIAMKDTQLMLKMVHLDSVYTKRLKMLLGSSPWFSKDEIGSKGLEAAFILVQHSPDYEFQKRSLPFIEKQAKNGDVSMQDYALLLDRTLMHDNNPQKYGTQVIEVKGEWVPDQIEDELNVDKRRSEIGLFPMQQYVGMINQFYKQRKDKK
jgi:hypothetical protein